MRNHVPWVPPKRLVFSGGGLRVVSFIGSLQVLEQEGILPKIREFSGVSAGAMLATMLALGYSLAKIERFFLEYDFSHVRSVEPEAVLGLFQSYGIDSGENLEKLIVKFLYHKGFQPTATFKDLADSGRCKGLRMWAADLEMTEPVEFSADLTPHISIVTALRASSAIPGYFVPIPHPDTGHLLVDGGVYDNYPISYLKPEEQEESLGFAFKFQSRQRSILSISDFIGAIVSGYYIPSYQELLKKHASRTIEIACYEFPSIHFEATIEEKKALIDLGREAAQSFVPPSKPFRRHSVA